MSEAVPDGESVSLGGVSDIVDQGELDKLNLKLWEKLDGKLPADISEADVLSLLSGVFSSDFEVRTSALGRLNRLGATAAQRLVDVLVKNPTNSTTAFQVTYALEEIGKRAVPSLIEALKKVEVKTPVDLTLLENITETLIRLNDKSAVPILIDYINRVNKELSSLPGNGNLSEHQRKFYELGQRTRLRIHDLLGDMGARDGLNDLLLLLGDGKKRVHVDVVETMRKIGDQRALVPLLRLYPLELTISDLGARYIKLTIREIVRREKVSLHGPLFSNLPTEEKETLDRLFRHQKHER